MSLETSPEPLFKSKIIHRIVSHNALYLNCTNGSAPLIKRAPGALDKKCFLTTSTELLGHIQNNFTEMCLMMPSTKIAQMVLLH